MKKSTLFLLTLSSQFILSLASAQMMKTDLKVVGPGGEVLIYYRDGNDIVVRNCGSNYPDVKKRSDCQTMGQENKVPVKSFKTALKSAFLITDADKIKPINKGDVDAFKAQKTPDELMASKAREQELSAKLSRIEGFIKEFGADDKSKKDKTETEQLLAQARADLSATQNRSDAVQKINKLVNDIVDIKIGSTKITTVSAGKHSDQAMYTLLRNFDASRVECGTDEILNGDKEQPQDPKQPARRVSSTDDAKTRERIANCSSISGNTKKTKAGISWSLVSRKRDKDTGRIYEVWKDSKSGLIWGDKLDSNYSQYKADSNGCGGAEGKRAQAGVNDKKFALPSIEDFKDAESNGIREVLPNMNDFFWSSSLVPDDADGACFFGGSSGFPGYGFRYGDGAVRCVGR